MLSNTNATATIAVKNLDNASKFYGETLGLSKVDTQGDGGITFESGNSKVFVYKSDFAGTNQATAMTWIVGSGELEPLVSSLKSKGVSFEHYNMPGMKRNGDIHGEGDMKTAWFKDPDGNILALVGG